MVTYIKSPNKNPEHRPAENRILPTASHFSSFSWVTLQEYHQKASGLPYQQCTHKPHKTRIVKLVRPEKGPEKGTTTERYATNASVERVDEQARQVHILGLGSECPQKGPILEIRIRGALAVA